MRKLSEIRGHDEKAGAFLSWGRAVGRARKSSVGKEAGTLGLANDATEKVSLLCRYMGEGSGKKRTHRDTPGDARTSQGIDRS